MAELPEPLMTYLVKREAQRADAVATFLAGLSDYERGLVHDAAVMGYVQGLMRDREEGAPKDSQVVALVVDACFAHPALYPAVNAEPAGEAHPSRHRWQVETLDPLADEWAPGMRFTDRAEAAERYETVSASHPTWNDGTPIRRRLARETTSFTVEEEQP